MDILVPFSIRKKELGGTVSEGSTETSNQDQAEA
jgi:hypothetical protein